MSRKKKRKIFDCIEYLSVEAPLEKVDFLENKQSKYIREYVKNKEYSIVGTERRHGFSQGDVNRQWAAIVKLIRDKRVDGVVVANMAAVSNSVPDAFYKVGQIIDAGGIIVTVDEGRLDMNIRRNCNDGEE
jgi:hypothetical protein